MENLIYGYDPYGGTWIVGPRTERGTIAEAMGHYAAAEDAEAALDKIRGNK
jgi:hypothetical protein